MINALLEPVWPYLLFAAAGVMAFFAVRTHRRGWFKDEDGEIQRREDHPRSFLFNELLGVVSVGLLIYLGYMALNGWK